MLQKALPRLSIIYSEYDQFQWMNSYEIDANTPKQILELNWCSFEIDFRFIIFEASVSCLIDILILSESTEIGDG